MYISHPKSEFVHMRWFPVFWSCIVIHEFPMIAAVAMHIYSSEQRHRLDTSASACELAVISGGKARSMYTNWSLLLDLYT